MGFRLATWNINSVRLRIEQVVRLLNEEAPDVLCLQETKCPPGQFPSAALHEAGYHHICDKGQSGYHGVAIISKLPFAQTSMRDFCGKQDARHVSVRLQGPDVTIHNFYVPAGGDEPDPDINEKFAHKISFLDEMTSWFSDRSAHEKGAGILVGDLNIAPLEHDVWSHRQLLKVVSHTPVEVERLLGVMAAGQWSDSMRKIIDPSEKLYTWWSYRGRDWEASNRGRRLDHIWSRGGIENAVTAIKVRKDCRGWERASDHVPVIADFNI